MRGAELYGAIVKNADLRGATLVESFLGGADFTGANFELADLRGAEFRRLSTLDWETLIIEITEKIPNRTVAFQGAGPRVYARNRLELAASRSDTNFPKYEAGWNAMYDPVPTGKRGAERIPLSDWPALSQDNEDFLVALTSLLTDLACEDKYIMLGIVNQILVSKSGARYSGSMLMRALADHSDNNETCPGIAALSVTERRRLKSLADWYTRFIPDEAAILENFAPWIKPLSNEP